ncbi:hypothetical protein M885DRAFT_577825 [Pelagophyceae sp. CCMP2097]|nr:hypothetical protein M885DRAFT_577825 [Pelagophyceae sp. CCMP2097]
MQLRIGAGMRMLAHRAAAGVVALVVGSASTAEAARSKPKPADEAARTTPSVLSFFQARTLAQRSAEKVKALAGIAERAAAKMKALAQETRRGRRSEAGSPRPDDTTTTSVSRDPEDPA